MEVVILESERWPFLKDYISTRARDTFVVGIGLLNCERSECMLSWTVEIARRARENHHFYFIFPKNQRDEQFDEIRKELKIEELPVAILIKGSLEKAIFISDGSLDVAFALAE